MPYTPNGKIDRQLLKNKMVVEKEMETPQNNNENNTEGKLVDLCKIYTTYKQLTMYATHCILFCILAVYFYMFSTVLYLLMVLFAAHTFLILVTFFNGLM